MPAGHAVVSSFLPSEPFPLLSAFSPFVRERLLKKIDYLTVIPLEETCRAIRESCQRLDPVFNVGTVQFSEFNRCRFYAPKKYTCVLDTIPSNGSTFRKEGNLPCRVYTKTVEIKHIHFLNVKNILFDIQRFKLTAKELIVEKYDLEGLLQIIEALKVKGIHFEATFPKELLSSDLIKNMSSIRIDRNCLDQEELLQLYNSIIVVNYEEQLAPKYGNSLLKEKRDLTLLEQKDRQKDERKTEKT